MADAYVGSLEQHRKRREIEEHLTPLPGVVAWHLVEAFLSKRIKAAQGRLKDAKGLQDIGQEQGRVAAFEELLNMRSAIMVDKEEG